MQSFARTVLFIHTSLLALASCGGERAEVDDTSAFRVALLTPGPISDQSWNASAFSGLNLIRDSLGASVSHIQTRTPAEFEENFRQYGARGFRLVFGHGFEFQEAAQRVGPEYPGTYYVTTGGNISGPNIAAMSFAFDEPSYLAGMTAATMSKSGIIGAIGGTELPPVKSSFTAFAAGARAVRPDITVLTAYLGNWDDAGAGKEQAIAQITRGADVIFQNADAAGLGVFQAVREATGAWIIGSNADQNAIAPAVTLGSVVIDVPRAFFVVAKDVRDGTFEPRVITFRSQGDVVRWVPNPGISAVPAPAAAAIDSVQAEMRAGRFSAPNVQSP
jgi:basic membrane lipoprotein Med (substrate-binding protein (PBP1-ABC) superfamily)